MKAISAVCLLLALTACNLPPRPASRAPVKDASMAGVPLIQWNAEQRHYEVREVDPATGKDAPNRAPIPLRGHFSVTTQRAVSNDGDTMAILESKGAGMHVAGCAFYADSICAVALHLVDLKAGRVTTASLPTGGWASAITFSTDGTRLALTLNQGASNTLMLFSPRGELLAQRTLNVTPNMLAFLGDTTLLVYGVPPAEQPGVSKPDAPRVMLLNMNLDVRWDYSLDGVNSGFWCAKNCNASREAHVSVNWQPAIVLSNDEHKLHIVHADSEMLTTVDLQLRNARNVSIQAAQLWFEKLLGISPRAAAAKPMVDGAHKSAALSPDGTKLYITGHAYSRHSHQSTPLGLQVIDVANGQRIVSQPLYANWLKMTPDGERLIAGVGDWSWGYRVVLDARSLRRVGQGYLTEVTITRRTNGEQVVLGRRPSQSSTEFMLFDPQSLQVTGLWLAEGTDSWWP